VLDAALDGGFVMGAEPDGRVRLLHRLGFHGYAVEVPEAPREGHRRLGPELLHDLDGLDEARHPIFRRDAVRGVEREIAAEPDARDQAAVAQVIERGQGLREVDGAAKGREQDGRAELHVLAQRGGVGEQLDRLEARGGADDLLLHPHAVEPERLGAPEDPAHEGEIYAAGGKHLGEGQAEGEGRHREPVTRTRCGPGRGDPSRDRRCTR
jgi:hypothetical protein